MSGKNSYEGMFIIKPDLSEDDTKRVLDSLSEEIVKGGGTVDERAQMGKQRFAYRIRNYQEGLYLRLNFHATAEVLENLAQRLKMSQDILRHFIARSA